MKKNIKTYSIAGLILIVGIFIGASLFSSESQNEEHDHSKHQESAEISAYTCSMHPQIRKDEPGDCPICGMELIPASTMEKSVDPDAIVMSKTARKLARVETMIVSNKQQKSGLEFSGRLEINKDQTQSLSANFNTRIERLFVNEEGEKVTQGQVIAELYAPKIQVLKEELELATQQENETLLKSITNKIQNYELSVNDVMSLKNGRLKLRSSKTGVISNLKVNQGDNLKAGQSLMSIADLSSLWAIVDVYESNLNKISVGDRLSIQTPNYQDISGKVTFITPVLNDSTRSARARVVVNNQDLKLKPGVFIKATLSVEKKNATSSKSLMLPKSAVLWTGKRSVVYQQSENENGVYFKMKEIETGKSSSDFVEVLSGLSAGDEVVTQGAFSVDAEAQLANKPSMMNPESGPAETGDLNGDMAMSKDSETESEISTETVSEQTDVVKDLINHYTELKNALVSDDFEASKIHHKQVNALLSEMNAKNFKNLDKLKSIEDLRDEFIQLSEEMISVVQKSNPTDETIYIQRCPMADSGVGARWISFSDQIKNPYYGASMLKCGSVIDSIQ
mgnify:CR=1 FL=1